MTTTAYEPLTLTDRCDRCNAAARKRYDLNGRDLLFCSHHDRALGKALRDKGAQLVEDRDALDALAADVDASMPETEQ